MNYKLSELHVMQSAAGYYLGYTYFEDDPTNVDTDPPDEYNVYSDQDGHACNTTVDGG
jgi:hypothetical protein